MTGQPPFRPVTAPPARRSQPPFRGASGDHPDILPTQLDQGIVVQGGGGRRELAQDHALHPIAPIRLSKRQVNHQGAQFRAVWRERVHRAPQASTRCWLFSLSDHAVQSFCSAGSKKK